MQEKVKEECDAFTAKRTTYLKDIEARLIELKQEERKKIADNKTLKSDKKEKDK